MPLAKVNKLKNKLGIKLFNKTFFGTDETKKDVTSKMESKFSNKKKNIGEKIKVSI